MVACIKPYGSSVAVVEEGLGNRRVAGIGGISRNGCCAERFSVFGRSGMHVAFGVRLHVAGGILVDIAGIGERDLAELARDRRRSKAVASLKRTGQEGLLIGGNSELKGNLHRVGDSSSGCKEDEELAD